MNDPNEESGRINQQKKAITGSKSRIVLGISVLIVAVVVPFLLEWDWVVGLSFSVVVGVLGLGLIVGSGIISVFHRGGIGSQRGNEQHGHYTDPSGFDDDMGGGGDGPF